MIRKVTFYWFVATLVLIDSWLLSKPNILGKIGLIIYKYHYLRSFPRTLLTVWIVVSAAIVIVWIIQRLTTSGKLSRNVSLWILSGCLAAVSLMLVKVVIDFTSWSYSHSGVKFRYGAYLLPGILMLVLGNGILGLLTGMKPQPAVALETEGAINEVSASVVSHDTLQPLQPESSS